jgi:hypothetical protein
MRLYARCKCMKGGIVFMMASSTAFSRCLRVKNIAASAEHFSRNGGGKSNLYDRRTIVYGS